VSRESWHKAQETRLIQPQRVQLMIAQLMIAQLTRVQLYVVLQTYNKNVSLMQPTNSM